MYNRNIGLGDKRVIDIHSHILFGVDDGPKNIEESLELLSLAVQEGITEIISTSHVLHPSFNVEMDDVVKQVAALQHLIHTEGLPLTLHTGHEIRINENVPDMLQQKKLLPLANSRYVLIELPSNSVPTYTKHLLLQLLELGYTPIIAHPERNKAIAENPDKLKQLVELGAFAQITAGSVAGHFGKSIQKTSLQLIEANLVHTYGSDVHSRDVRPYLFDAGLTYLEKHKHADTVEVFLENNARILTNDSFIVFEPQLIREKKWWQIF